MFVEPFDKPRPSVFSGPNGSCVVKISLAFDTSATSAGEIGRTGVGASDKPLSVDRVPFEEVALRLRFMAEGGSFRREEGDCMKIGEEVDVWPEGYDFGGVTLTGLLNSDRDGEGG